MLLIEIPNVNVLHRRTKRTRIGPSFAPRFFRESCSLLQTRRGNTNSQMSIEWKPESSKHPIGRPAVSHSRGAALADPIYECANLLQLVRIKSPSFRMMNGALAHFTERNGVEPLRQSAIRHLNSDVSPCAGETPVRAIGRHDIVVFASGRWDENRGHFRVSKNGARLVPEK